MRRRTLFGLIPLPLLGLFGGGQGPFPMPSAMPIEPWIGIVNTGPTMNQLIGLALSDKHARGNYDRLLSMALQKTGPVVMEFGDPYTIFHCNGIPAARFGHAITLLPRACDVLVPKSLLPYFRPENRGEEFPQGIPFKRMP
jgi:hypothetical protein